MHNTIFKTASWVCLYSLHLLLEFKFAIGRILDKIAKWTILSSLNKNIGLLLSDSKNNIAYYDAEMLTSRAREKKLTPVNFSSICVLQTTIDKYTFTWENVCVLCFFATDLILNKLSFQHFQRYLLGSFACLHQFIAKWVELLLVGFSQFSIFQQPNGTSTESL